MSLHKAKILGIGVTTDSKQSILEEVGKYLKKPAADSLQRSAIEQKPFVIVTPNPEQVVLAQKDIHFREILNQADVAIPDGVGLLAAMRLLVKQSAISHQLSAIKRIPGIELMEDLVEIAAKEGVKIGLIGGRDGVAVKALECLQRKHHGLEGIALELPELSIADNRLVWKYYGRSIMNYGMNNEQHPIIHNTNPILHSTETVGEYIQKIVQHLVEQNVRLVFVGLGAPKQEYVIEAISQQLSANSQNISADSGELQAGSCILMSVGGSFDEISGRIPRSPRIIDQMGLKWLWRLVLEPWRWRRQLALIRFVWLVIHEKMR